jgi:hypothetical protein
MPSTVVRLSILVVLGVLSGFACERSRTTTASEPGVLIVMAPPENQLFLSSRRLRQDSLSPDNPETLIFDSERQVMYTISHNQKSYVETTGADLDQNRQVLEQLLAGRDHGKRDKAPGETPSNAYVLLLSPSGEEIETRSLESSTSAGVPCSRYDVFEKATKIRRAEICVAKPADVPITDGDFAVVQALRDFLDRGGAVGLGAHALNLVPQSFLGTAKDAFGMDGVTLRLTPWLGGEVEVSKIVRQTFPASTFAVPPGYTKRPASGQ